MFEQMNTGLKKCLVYSMLVSILYLHDKKKNIIPGFSFEKRKQQKLAGKFKKEDY